MRERLNQTVTDRLHQQRLRELLEERALARESIDIAKVQQIKEDMERAQARRLQPHFIAAFFLEAFEQLGGSVRQREPQRYEITHVPALIRNQGRQVGVGEPILRRYKRICFEKELISSPGKPLASFICPGHPQINSTKARQRADDLETRLLHRLEELEQERRLSPLPPVVIGGNGGGCRFTATTAR